MVVTSREHNDAAQSDNTGRNISIGIFEVELLKTFLYFAGKQNEMGSDVLVGGQTEGDNIPGALEQEFRVPTGLHMM